ncbi:MAG: hypothetical protein RLZZ338_2664 [Cyanobacteriota bacterium]|jgi:adenylosuccinate synthase
MQGKITVVVGGQFGSEAKGKVVSYLANEYDIAVRTGSPNAGHTVVFENNIYKLQQIPATFLNNNCTLCIGAGALIDPKILKREVEITQTKNRLFIDPMAGIIEAQHAVEENLLSQTIGSTGKGCGAALIDRIRRQEFKFAKNCLQEYQITDTTELINKGIDNGQTVLVEGTQGFGLSIYHGFYPYVTSRDTTAASFITEAGISPRLVTDIILVVRTYPIRVAGNSGPLPNEISWSELSKRIGKNIQETSTVTKKIRRIAEFDMEIVKRAIIVNRPTQIALQFLNYLFPEDENVVAWSELSSEAKHYVTNMENQLGIPITLIGTGQSHDAMIDRR